MKIIPNLWCPLSLALVGSTLIYGAATAQNIQHETQKLFASDGAAGDKFGHSVSVSGDWAIVGVPGDSDTGEHSGSAYVYKRIGGVWTETQKLLASDGAPLANFGHATSISGDRIIVGAIQDDDNGVYSGAAYVYECNGEVWGETAKLTASDGAEFDTFGYSVSISGNRAIVGAYGNDDNGLNTGAAYVFERLNGVWVETAKLLASDGAAQDHFSISVSISGEEALVGAYLDDDLGASSGSTYVFERVNGVWVETAKLLASDAAGYDYFGRSVFVSGNRAIVGAYGDDVYGTDSGSAYVYDRINGVWTETAKLSPSDGAFEDRFGFSVAISGNRAIVGSRGDEDDGEDSGSAYLFELSNNAWNNTAKLTASDGASHDWFGLSVSISGDYAIIGASGLGDVVQKSGSAYVFQFNETPVADAGPDQATFQGAIVTLDGSGSYAPAGNYPLVYSWQLIAWPEASATELHDADTVSPSLVPDLRGDYSIQLIVTDSQGNQSPPDTVVLSTLNTAPVADAGPDQALLVLNTTVQLDGTQSYDNEGDPFFYYWELVQKPENSLAVLNGADTGTPTFVADVYGDYVLCLTVTDIFGAFRTDFVTLSFANVKPVADAGGNQAVVVGQTVLLDGSASSDANGDLLAFQWSFVSKPDTSQAALTAPLAVQTEFIPDLPGTYVMSLVVNDGLINSDPDNVTVEAITRQNAIAANHMELIRRINGLPADTFKNENLRHTLTSKLNAALGMLENQAYGAVLNKLVMDILPKTDGCAIDGAPDANDWITNCEDQGQVYPLILETVELLFPLL